MQYLVNVVDSRSNFAAFATEPSTLKLTQLGEAHVDGIAGFPYAALVESSSPD